MKDVPIVVVEPFPCGVVWCGVVWCGVVWCGVHEATHAVTLVAQIRNEPIQYRRDGPHTSPRSNWHQRLRAHWPFGVPQHFCTN
jgi:hypothetical protein